MDDDVGFVMSWDERALASSMAAWYLWNVRGATSWKSIKARGLGIYIYIYNEKIRKNKVREHKRWREKIFQYRRKKSDEKKKENGVMNPDYSSICHIINIKICTSFNMTYFQLVADER
jgi:hypothetical protein